MGKIYQLMMGKKQVNDLYYDETDAFENAKQIVIDTDKPIEIWDKPIEIWVAEEIEGVPVDALEWFLDGIVGTLYQVTIRMVEEKI
jgi:hypothetical protein